MWRLISQAAPRVWCPSAASHSSPGIPFAKKIPPFASSSPETRRAAFRPAPPATVRPAASSARRRCRASSPAYIERQLAAFAQGWRQNDINEQMRTIAARPTPDRDALAAEFYGDGATYKLRIAKRSGSGKEVAGKLIPASDFARR